MTSLYTKVLLTEPILSLQEFAREFISSLVGLNFSYSFEATLSALMFFDLAYIKSVSSLSLSFMSAFMLSLSLPTFSKSTKYSLCSPVLEISFIAALLSLVFALSLGSGLELRKNPIKRTSLLYNLHLTYKKRYQG